MALSYERRHLSFAGFQTRPGGAENLVGVPRIIFDDPTDHAFAALGPPTLITVPIPAGSLRIAGDFLEYVAEYVLQGVGNSKTITYSFGGVYRLTATTCRCYIQASLPFLGQANPFTQFGDIVVANMDSNTLNFVVTVAAVADNDVVHKVSHMYIIQN